jgi:anti-sigma factor RsiW
MGDLTHSQLQELLGAYALDAVDDDERDLVEAHLVGCPRCRAEVAEHREVAARLAHTGTAAPPGLWDRIAASLEEAPPPLVLPPPGTHGVATRPDPDPAAPGSAPAGAIPIRRGGPPPAVRWLAAAAAVAALVVAVAGIRVALDSRRASWGDALARSFVAALSDRGSKTVVLRSPDGRLSAQLVLAPDGTGYLAASELPRLAPDRTYQLWALVGDQRVSSGVLGARPGLRAFPADPAAAGYAITEERAGGVATTTHQPVVVGLLVSA